MNRTIYRLTRLPGGLSVATAELPWLESVSLGIWTSVGARHESVQANGVCHFIEHMLFKGTRRRSARDISQAIEGLGGQINAFTAEDHACFYAKATHDKIAVLMDVLGDMIVNSRFDPRELVKERQVIKEEVAMYLDQPHHLVQEILNETLWPGHPLGRPLTGTPQSLDALDRRQLVRFWRRGFTAPALSVVAAGQIRHRDLVRLARPLSRRLGSRMPPEFSRAAEDQQAPRIALRPRRTEQMQIAWGIRSCSRHDERRFALRLIHAILGENMSSRLFQIVREDYGFVYHVGTSMTQFEDTGVLSIAAGLAPRHLLKTLKLIRRELARLATELTTRAELNRAKDYVLGQFDLGLEGSEGHMNWLGEHLVAYDRLPDPRELRRQIRDVTPSTVRAAAAAFFKPHRFSLALVGPRMDLGPVRKVLTR